MIKKFLAIVIMLCVGTGAAAQSVKPRSVVTTKAHVKTKQDQVLDKIIGRVQLDALIDQIVAKGDDGPGVRHGDGYATNGSIALRDRG